MLKITKIAVAIRFVQQISRMRHVENRVLTEVNPNKRQTKGLENF